jgi:mannose-6-phosphate isomerase
MATSSHIIKLAPGIQPYAWGKKGGSSIAAQFAKVSVPDFQIEDEKTYAEVGPFAPTICPASSLCTV